MFTGVLFREEADLIELLPLIRKYLGKYDLYSGYIKNPVGGLAAGSSKTLRLKMFSFETLCEPSKIRKFFLRAQKVAKVAKPGPGIESVFSGFVNERQAVLLFDEAAPDRIWLAPGVFGSVQFCLSGSTGSGRFIGTPWTLPELSWRDSVKYLEDLRRVCLTQKG